MISSANSYSGLVEANVTPIYTACSQGVALRSRVVPYPS